MVLLMPKLFVCPVIRTPLEFEPPLVLILPKSVTLLLSPPSIIKIPDELPPVVETLPVTLTVLLLDAGPIRIPCIPVAPPVDMVVIPPVMLMTLLVAFKLLKLSPKARSTDELTVILPSMVSVFELLVILMPFTSSTSIEEPISMV